MNKNKISMPRLNVKGTEIYSFYNKKDWPAYNFANYAPGEVTVDGIKYPTREHAFQAQKLSTDIEKKRFSIKYWNSGPNAARVAMKYQTPPDGWHDGGSSDAMYKVINCFAQQNLAFKEQLLSTDKMPIIEDTAGADYIDDNWGVGYGPYKDRKKEPENRLGFLLMKLRAEIRNKEQDQLPEISSKDEAETLNRIGIKATEDLGYRGPKLIQQFDGETGKLLYLPSPQTKGRLLQNTRGVSILPDLPIKTNLHQSKPKEPSKVQSQSTEERLGQTASNYATSEMRRRYSGNPSLEIRDDDRPNRAGQKQLYVTFDTPEDAMTFSKQHGNANITNGGKTVRLGEERTEWFALNTLDINPGQHSLFIKELTDQIYVKPQEKASDKIPNVLKEGLDLSEAPEFAIKKNSKTDENFLEVSFSNKEDSARFKMASQSPLSKYRDGKYIVICHQTEIRNALIASNCADPNMTLDKLVTEVMDKQYKEAKKVNPQAQTHSPPKTRGAGAHSPPKPRADGARPYLPPYQKPKTIVGAGAHSPIKDDLRSNVAKIKTGLSSTAPRTPTSLLTKVQNKIQKLFHPKEGSKVDSRNISTSDEELKIIFTNEQEGKNFAKFVGGDLNFDSSLKNHYVNVPKEKVPKAMERLYCASIIEGKFPSRITSYDTKVMNFEFKNQQAADDFRKTAGNDPKKGLSERIEQKVQNKLLGKFKENYRTQVPSFSDLKREFQSMKKRKSIIADKPFQIGPK